jgi:hypothetical protein
MFIGTGGESARRTWRPTVRKVALIGWTALLAYWGGNGIGLVEAAPPTPALDKAAVAPAEPANDNAHRWVAVIFGNEPITREDFAEYLIARHVDKLELLVNKRIIEHACKERAIDVTAGEVEAALAEDLQSMKISLSDFQNKVLKQYKKTLYEWKEDVIRPKLLMTKLCRDRVQITDQDFQDAFNAYYGEKVDCRIILWPKGEEKHAMNAYAELRKSEADFDRYARQQASASLASTGGHIRPISHKTTGNDELEKEAFTLQPGEVSRLIGTPEGTVVMRCVGRIPPDTSKKLDGEKTALQKEIFEKKLQQEMPRLFKELQEKAQPKLFLKHTTTEEELERDVKRELQPVSPSEVPNTPPPKKP